MREEFKPFFDENFTMSPWGEDNLLYSSEFAVLSNEFTKEMTFKAIESYNHEGTFYINENNKTFSHDMLIGLVCLSKNKGFNYHNHWQWFFGLHRIQPWNVAFYLFIMDDFRHYLGLLLLPILSLYMTFNLLVHKYDENNVLQTSEQMLIWLMLNTVKMPLTRRLCDYIVKKRVGSYYEYAKIYFGETHPIPILMKEQNI